MSKGYKRLIRNHIYEKLEELLKTSIQDKKVREDIKNKIYKLFHEMV